MATGPIRPKGPLPPADNVWWEGKSPGKLRKFRAGVIVNLQDYGHYDSETGWVAEPSYPLSRGHYHYHLNQPLVKISDRSRSALHFKRATVEKGGAYFLGNTQRAVRFLRKCSDTASLLREGLYGVLREDYLPSDTSLKVYKKVLHGLRPDLPGVKWFNHLSFCLRKVKDIHKHSLAALPN